MPKARSRNGRRRKAPYQIVQTLDPIQTLNRALALRSDMIVVKDKCSKTVTISATGVTQVPLNVTSTVSFFGSRIAAMAALYTRFKILKVNMIPIAVSGAFPVTTNSITTGIIDDYSVSVTTLDDVFSLRCSASLAAIGNPTGSNMLTWEPLDNTKWYYTSLDSGDNRFVIPAAYAAFNTSGSAFTVEYGVWFTLVLDGATAVGSSG
jgi:hypothetical protein